MVLIKMITREDNNYLIYQNFTFVKGGEGHFRRESEFLLIYSNINENICEKLYF